MLEEISKEGHTESWTGLVFAEPKKEVWTNFGRYEAKWVFVDTNGDYSGVRKSNTSYTERVSIADLSADTSVSLTGILIGDVNDSYSGLIA